MGNLQDAIKDADEALSLLDTSSENRSRRARVLRVKGVCFHDLGNSDEAVVFISDALELYRLEMDDVRIAGTLLDLGMVYRGRGELKLAGEFYLQAMDYLRKSNDKTRQANVFNNLGRFYHLQGDYPKASWRFNQAMERAQQIGYSRMEAFILTSFGEIFVELDAYKSASHAFQLSRQIVERLKHRSLAFQLDLAEASFTRKQGDFVRAHQFLVCAEKYVKSSSSVYEKGLYKLESGITALLEHQNDVALESISSAYRLLTEDPKEIGCGTIPILPGSHSF